MVAAFGCQVCLKSEINDMQMGGVMENNFQQNYLFARMIRWRPSKMRFTFCEKMKKTNGVENPCAPLIYQHFAMPSFYWLPGKMITRIAYKDTGL